MPATAPPTAPPTTDQVEDAFSRDRVRTSAKKKDDPNGVHYVRSIEELFPNNDATPILFDVDPISLLDRRAGWYAVGGLSRRVALFFAALYVLHAWGEMEATYGALGGAALRLLELHLHAVECIARLVDLPVQIAALRWWIGEDREEARALAAHLAGLRHQPVDLELLLVHRILEAAQLLGAARIVVAGIERGELGDESLAVRTGRLRDGGGGPGERDGGGGGGSESPHGRHLNRLIVALRGHARALACALSARRFQTTPAMMMMAPMKTKTSSVSP